MIYYIIFRKYINHASYSCNVEFSVIGEQEWDDVKWMYELSEQSYRINDKDGKFKYFIYDMTYERFEYCIGDNDIEIKDRNQFDTLAKLLKQF